MRAAISVGGALCVTTMTLALASAANAAAVRTFISGTGNDSYTSSNCPRATPCRTLAGAYGVTSSGGEIVMIDPAGYGAVSFTGPITLVGVPGAAISAPSGGSGITVATGSNSDVVVVNGVQIDGANATNSIGITVTKGNLVLQDSTLKLLTTGLSVGGSVAVSGARPEISAGVTATVDIANSNIIGTTTAILTNGAGVNTVSGPPYPIAPVLVRLHDGNIVNNTTAFSMTNVGSDTNGNCEPTFWAYVVNGQPWINVAGYTTFLAQSPSTPSCGVSSYYSNPSEPAPNNSSQQVP